MIVVGATCASWKCNGIGELAWLANAEAMIDDAASIGEELKFFVALEVDARGAAPFRAVEERIDTLDFKKHNTTYQAWRFSLDDDAYEINSGNRLIRICTGRNLIIEYAMRTMASHILFLDTDLRVPGDSITKLMAVQHPVVGGDVPQYGLHGPSVSGGVAFPLEEHWNTAGFLLVQRDVFNRVRWRTDIMTGLTDDPCFDGDAYAAHFGHTWVRKDVVGVHVEPLVPVEQRDADRKIYR